MPTWVWHTTRGNLLPNAAQHVNVPPHPATLEVQTGLSLACWWHPTLSDGGWPDSAPDILERALQAMAGWLQQSHLKINEDGGLASEPCGVRSRDPAPDLPHPKTQDCLWFKNKISVQNNTITKEEGETETKIGLLKFLRHSGGDVRLQFLLAWSSRALK